MSQDGPVAAGPHAYVEVVDSGSSGKEELRVTVNVPFELQSMADAELDVGVSSVRLRGPAPANEEVSVALPDGFVLDPDTAAARFSKKKQQLIISSPHKPAATPSVVAAPKSVEQPLRPVPAAAATEENSASVDDDDDDDDLPPPLDASRSASCKPVSDLASDLQETVAANLGPSGLPETEETNEAANALMQKALAARQQKQKETEEARRKADLASGAGLKKGFLSGAKSKKRASEKVEAKVQEAEEIPFISGAVDAEAARRESLKLPEVQKAIAQSTQQLKNDQSWVTPQLLQALGSRPDIATAMSDPKVQEAMQLMQTDPEAAKHKYKDDPKVTKFLKDFTGLMATHFEVLSKEAPNPPKASSSQAPKPVDAPITGLDLGAKPPPAAAMPAGYSSQAQKGERLPIEDPAVAAAFQDPEVQALIAAIRAGQPFEMHQLARTNERLFHKVRILLDSGLLAMQH